MVPALDDLQQFGVAAGDPVYEPVLAGDAAGPPAGEAVLQRLRLAEPLEGIAADVTDEVVDALQDFRIVPLPVDIVFPGFVRPQKPHSCGGISMRSCSDSAPFSAL